MSVPCLLKEKNVLELYPPKAELLSLPPLCHLQLGDPAIFPAVIVEHVPGADILNSYAGLACVEEPNDMITESSLDVAEEEIIDDEDDDITFTGVCVCVTVTGGQGMGQVFPGSGLLSKI